MRCCASIPLVSKWLEARANRINTYKCFIWAAVLEQSWTYAGETGKESNVQPRPRGILPFWYCKTRSFNYRSLNINSICNKFEMLSMSVAQYVDISVIRNKLDITFPSIQVLINGFSVSHRLDWNSKGGGIWPYVREKAIVLPLKRYSLPPHIEILFFELNLRNRKWLVCCSYNPNKNILKIYLQVFTESIQFY